MINFQEFYWNRFELWKYLNLLTILNVFDNISYDDRQFIHFNNFSLLFCQDFQLNFKIQLNAHGKKMQLIILFLSVCDFFFE